MCLWCTRFREGFECEAFPEGIPDAVLFEHVDHRFEHRGDGGLRFVSNGDEVVNSTLDTHDELAHELALGVAPSLAEFCRAAGINPTPLLALRRRSHSMGSWEPSHIGAEAEVVAAESTRDPFGAMIDPPVAQILLGDPGEVILTLDANGDVIVSEFAVQWFGPAQPVALRLEGHEVRVPKDGSLVERSERVAEAVGELRRRRRRRFARCVRCTEMTPPEWWFGEGHCQGCASKYLGVVF